MKIPLVGVNVPSLIAAMSPPANLRIGDRSVMVIDDDEISLSLVSLLLEAEGYDVIQAAGGTAALELVASLPPDSYPDIVIADLRMPGLSGQELAAELRRAVPRAKVLAMSATPDAAEGYDGFLSKPLNVAALRSLLNGHAVNPEPEPEASDALPVLDQTVYEKLARMMSPAGLRETYEACVNDVRLRVAEMRTAAATNDLGSVRRIAHTLKGSAGMIGARRLTACAAELELGSYDTGPVFNLIDKLLSCCDDLHRILLAKLP